MVLLLGAKKGFPLNRRQKSQEPTHFIWTPLNMEMQKQIESQVDPPRFEFQSARIGSAVLYVNAIQKRAGAALVEPFA